MAPDTTLRIYCENLHNFKFIYIDLHSINIDKNNDKYHGKFHDLTEAIAHALRLRVIRGF
jgi:hypothetical protein